MSTSRLRKTAYEYIRDHMCKLHELSCESDNLPVVPLNELVLLKEGLADPSAELVAALKQLLRGALTEAEIDAHLVAPFHHKTD